jgi:hypothetical protein
MKASTKHWRMPSAVMMFLEKKSHCHRPAACALRNSAHVPLPESVLGSNSFCRRMLTTVDREIFTPSFLSSPRTRV